MAQQPGPAPFRTGTAVTGIVATLLISLAGCAGDGEPEPTSEPTFAQRVDQLCDDVTQRFTTDLSVAGANRSIVLPERARVLRDLRDDVREIGAPPGDQFWLDEWLRLLGQLVADLGAAANDDGAVGVLSAAGHDNTLDDVAQAAFSYGFTTCAETSSWNIVRR